MRSLLILTFLLAPVSAAYASAISVVLPDVLTFDQAGIAHVVLNTEGATINAAEGTITFPAPLRIVSVETGASAFTLWIEGPTVSGNSVAFVGAIPNGLRGADVPLFDVTFVADTLSGSEAYTMSTVSVFPNTDSGISSPASLPSEISWSFATTSDMTLLRDTTAPEPFSVVITQDPNIFSGRFVALFSAVDKQSGMDYFEFQEHTAYAPDESAWKQARSPVLLTDQSQSSHVSVKAVDRSGNIRIVTVEPPRGRGIVTLGAVFFGLLLGLLLYVFSRKRKK